ncbi:MAG: ParB/RepB/Spo0J family partition protein [Patescibacteria group bacterium]|nr:ParB/RepB/Spo0J family partition protein [Patescibacteria group bacterium]
MTKHKDKRLTSYQPIRTAEGYLLWDVSLIQPNPKQPRRYFDPVKIEALKQSIKEMGVLTPLRILPFNVSGFAKLIDGERRFRAATELGLKQVPVILSACLTKDEKAQFKESVIANFCREEMTEIEIAKALEQLMNMYGYSQAEVSRLVGKTQSWVANMLKFLKLHPVVADWLGVRQVSPLMALYVSRYPKDQQKVLAERLLLAKKTKGSPLTSHEILLKVSEEAQNLGTLPAKPKKTGRMPETDPKRLVIKAATRQAQKLNPLINDLLERRAWEGTGGELLILLEQEIKVLSANLSKLNKILGEVI